MPICQNLYYYSLQAYSSHEIKKTLQVLKSVDLSVSQFLKIYCYQDVNCTKSKVMVQLCHLYIEASTKKTSSFVNIPKFICMHAFQTL